MKRTSFNVPADLWHKFRLAALERKKTAGEALEDAIRAWIEKAA